MPGKTMKRLVTACTPDRYSPSHGRAPRAMADIMNDHLILPDFVHDQIVTDGEPSEYGFACRLSHIWRGRNSCGNVFNASDKTRRRLPIVRRYVRKNLIEVGKGAALISELHAIR
jgi:hypothetical protein